MLRFCGPAGPKRLAARERDKPDTPRTDKTPISYTHSAPPTTRTASSSAGATPASASALKRIPIVRVAADDLTKDNECCTICLEDHVPGELAARLPCGHLFHQDCVVEWLRRHCVCPVCRYELPTDSVVYERTRREHNREGGRRVRVLSLRHI